MDPADLLFSPWGWLSLATITAGLELLVPGIYLIWVAFAALLTAITAGLLGVGMGGQMAAFAVWIVLSLLAAKRWSPNRIAPSDDPLLNQRSARLVGMRVTVSEAITNGRGRVRLGDGEWNAEGPDAAVGSEVQIIAADGVVLRVAPVDDA